MKSGKIYTKRGDKGETGTLKGRVSKGNQVAITLGTIDELNSWMGLCRSLVLYDEVEVELQRVQYNLLCIGSAIAGSEKRVSKKEVERLEKLIDEMTESLPKLGNFIYPTGRGVSAYLQVARTIARRAEREVVSCVEKEGVVINEIILQYLNRLSDYLFTVARYVNLKLGGKDEVWK